MKTKDRLLTIFPVFTHNTPISLLIHLWFLSFRTLLIGFYQLHTHRAHPIDSQYLSDINYESPAFHADTLSSKLCNWKRGSVFHLSQIVVPRVLIRETGQLHSHSVKLHSLHVYRQYNKKWCYQNMMSGMNKEELP